MEAKHDLSAAPAHLMTPTAIEALRLLGISATGDSTAAQLAQAAQDISCARHPEAHDQAAALSALARWAALPSDAPQFVVEMRSGSFYGAETERTHRGVGIAQACRMGADEASVVAHDWAINGAMVVSAEKADRLAAESVPAAKRPSVFVQRLGADSSDLELALATLPITIDDGLGDLVLDVIARVDAVILVLGDDADLAEAGRALGRAQSMQRQVYLLATAATARRITPPHLRLMAVGAAVPDPSGRWLQRLRHTVARFAVSLPTR